MNPSLCDTFYPSFMADVFVAVIGGVLGLGAAYYVYLLSVWQVRKDRLKYIVTLIQTIVPSALRQATYCEEYAGLITQHPFTNEYLRLEANRDSKRLSDKADQEGVYHAYLWKYGRTADTYKNFQLLYGYIDYIDYLIDDLISTNEKNRVAIWERKKQYQLIYKNAQEVMQSLSLIPELQETQPELIMQVGALLEEFTQKHPGGENLVESYTIVVQPLQRYIVSSAKPHPKITELLFFNAGFVQ